MSFRVKLVFNSKNDWISQQFRKIWFPVNTNECQTIKDLKFQIKSFLLNGLVSSSNFEFDLKIDGYLLHDIFETNVVLKENDEIDACINEKSVEEKEATFLKKKTEREVKKTKNTKKTNFVSLSSSESEEEIEEERKKPNKKTLNINTEPQKKKIKNKNDRITFTEYNNSSISLPNAEKELNICHDVPSFISENKIEKKGILKNSNKNEEFIYNTNKTYEKKVNFKSTPKIKDKKYYSYKNIYDKDPQEYNSTYENSSERIEFDLSEYTKIENLKNCNELLTVILTENSKILFKLYELVDSNPEISKNYRLGTVLNFSEDRRITIKLDKQNDNYDYLLDTYSQNVENYENNIIILPINEILEMLVEKSKSNLIENFTHKLGPCDKKNSSSNGEKLKINDNVMNVDNSNNKKPIYNVSKEPSKEEEKKREQPKKNIFTNNILHALRRQIEFYFSNKNYYTDPFIKQNLDQDNYINLDLIMGFNRVKTLTDNKEDIINALRDSSTVQFDETYSKLKKKI